MDVFAATSTVSALAMGISLFESPGSSGGGFSDKRPGKIRSACNRCHAQKLKCVRRAEQGSSCERCLRLKTSCRFALRAARSSRKVIEQVAIERTLENPFSVPASIPMPLPQSHIPSPGVSSETEWLYPLGQNIEIEAPYGTLTNPTYPVAGNVEMGELDWAGLSGIEKNAEQQLAAEGSATFDLTPVFDNVASMNDFCYPAMLQPGMRIDNPIRLHQLDLNPYIVHRSASLDVAIHECGLLLPHPTRAGSNSDRNGARKSRLFALDELFRLTTEFLEIIRCLCHEAGQINLSPFSKSHIEADSELNLPLFQYSQHFPETVQPAAIGKPAMGSPYLDDATMFMIMSCHSRLTEVYGSVFKMMQACIKHSRAPRRDNDWAIILPQLHVGSVASPSVQVDINNPVSKATSSMYMLLITMLSSQLWEQLANKMRVDVGSLVRTGSRSMVTKAVWHNVTSKNDCVLQTLDNTRRLLLAAPV